MKRGLQRVDIDVLLKLAYSRLPFSKIWDRTMPSNRFTYHLKELQRKGLVDKVENEYALTHSGESVVAHLSEEGYDIKEQPILGVIIVVQRKNDFLVSLRKKEPFKGHYGFTHGRISIGEGVEDAAFRILKERTGLKARRFSIKGIWLVNTVRNKKVHYTHLHFILKCDDFAGRATEDTKEFANMWIGLSALNRLKRFHDDDYILEIAEGKGFSIAEADRFQEKGEFRGIKIKKRHDF